MTVARFKQVPAAEALRRFSEINDAALKEPVVLTRNGRARTVLLSVETFERFLANERSVFLAKDTPEEFLPTLEAIAAGAFDKAGIADELDRRVD
jgi:PHD/YefM family antitoxin component YafN of YafNO toxin-antitoxin module